MRAILRRAGWREDADREAPVQRWIAQLAGEFTPFAAAMDALRRYGGVNVLERGAGVECGRSPFQIDPTLAIGEQDRFEFFAGQLGTRLYPLGEVSGGRAFLGIGEDGRVFFFDMEIWMAGGSIDDAVERLARGLRSEKLRYEWG